MAPDIQRTEVDGVPVFWVAEAPRTLANLKFRVGRVDEPFRLTGITHLLEHLAIHRVGERNFPVNGKVDHVATEFVCVGLAEENAAYLGDITAAFADLDPERLAREVRVLRVEDDRQPPSAVREYVNLRYGSANLGRISLPENALHTATIPELHAWAGHWLTKGNAVGWMSGAPPAGMRLVLPDGERQPTVQHRDITPLPLPSWGATRMPGAMVGAPLPRSAAAAALGRILRLRAERRLRGELGLSYDVGGVYMRLDGTDALVMAIVSSRDEDAARAAGELVGVLDALAGDGPTVQELADDAEQMGRAFADPDAVLGALNYAADCELYGYPYQTQEELRAESLALRPEDVGAMAARLRDTAVGFSHSVPRLGPPWQPYPIWSTDAVAGRSYDSTKKKYPWTKGTPTLVVGDEGITLLTPEGRPVTVRYTGCTGIIRNSLARIVIGDDGFRLTVNATEWKNGNDAVLALDRALPVDRYVDWQS